MFKRDGIAGKSLSVCLTFNTPNLPSKIKLGYEFFAVKPYIPPVVRCFNCQRLGHVANVCRSKIRCVRCSGSHSFDECTQKDQVQCSRCGGDHSSAYAGCTTYKEEKKIQEVRVIYNISYAEAAKTIRTNITVLTNKDSDDASNRTQQNTKTRLLEETILTTPSAQRNTHKTQITTTSSTNKKDMSTQTETETSTQTEPISQYIQPNQALIELLIGTMRIWESARKLENKEAEIKCLVEFLFQTTNICTPKSKAKRNRAVPQSQSPNRTTNHEEKTKNSQSKSKPKESINGKPQTGTPTGTTSDQKTKKSVKGNK